MPALKGVTPQLPEQKRVGRFFQKNLEAKLLGELSDPLRSMVISSLTDYLKSKLSFDNSPEIG